MQLRLLSSVPVRLDLDVLPNRGKHRGGVERREDGDCLCNRDAFDDSRGAARLDVVMRGASRLTRVVASRAWITFRGP